MAVAMDVTPLLSFRTGIGLSVAGMWAGLQSMKDGPRMSAYALGLRNGSTGAGLPSNLRRVRIPARVAVQAWSRFEHPRVDPWLGDVTVVHATNYVTPPSLHPTVVTVNDLSFVYDPPDDPVVATFHPMLRRAVSRGAHIHVTTRQVAAEVEDVLGPGLAASGRITVVAFGIPPAVSTEGAYPPAAPTQASNRFDEVAAGRPYVLFIGTDEPRKNIPLLVEAFGEVSAQLPDLRLVIAGRETEHTERTRAAISALAPAVASKVVRLGPVDDATRARLLADAWVMAYPSRYEGFGFPVLEAMRAGVPVVAADVAVLREVAGQAALFADPGDVSSLAGALRAAAADGAQRELLISSGKERAASFTWEATASGLGALYERAAGSPGPGRDGTGT